MAFSKAIVKFLSKSGFGHSYNFVDFVKTAWKANTKIPTYIHGFFYKKILLCIQRKLSTNEIKYLSLWWLYTHLPSHLAFLKSLLICQLYIWSTFRFRKDKLAEKLTVSCKSLHSWSSTHETSLRTLIIISNLSDDRSTACHHHQ
jgi:hypothetical protein